jgi:starch phosphorylase
VVFVPNYSVTVAEYLIPATELSEQISTAGFEASGTGNMKFAMNGAMTIGTLDGANIEIKEEVGDENIFIFGNTVQQVKELNANGVNPGQFYGKSERIRQIMDLFKTDMFSPGEPGRFSWVYHALVDHWDPYFHLADLDSYIDQQFEVDKLYQNQVEWNKKAILNTARMAKFSSDRTIKEYADEIWGIKSIPH